MSETNNAITLVDIAGQLSGIYDDFTEAVQALGAKGKKRSGKLMGSFAHWIGGGHVHSDREALCEKFLEDVQKQLEMLQMYMEGAEDDEITEACDLAADIITEPRPEKSDSTTDLMKRAMIGQIEPFLSYCSTRQLNYILDRFDAAYSKRNRLPVEKSIRKEIVCVLESR